jgi:hypothetical protein
MQFDVYFGECMCYGLTMEANSTEDAEAILINNLSEKLLQMPRQIVPSEEIVNDDIFGVCE